jgi:formamidopyrimidine-DNA glycosylase
MPELPEVETVVRDLRPLVVGQAIVAVRVGPQPLRQAWQEAWTPAVAGQCIQSLRRRGKWILVDLPKSALLLHLGMTGQLTVHADDEPLADHVHVIFQFPDAQQLRFRDVRRFGSASYFPTHDALERFLNDRLGPEPFDIPADYFNTAIKKSDRPLKAILLDQTVLAGIGNIYADESCFRAGLHPGRRGKSLRDAELDRLRLAIEAVLLKAVSGRGSTIRDYIGGSGLKGTFQDEFAVYARAGAPCYICRTKIEVMRIAGRSSHWCPQCQAG